MTNSPNEYAIGIDIGGTSTHVGLVERQTGVCRIETIPATQYTSSWSAFMEEICSRIERLRKDLEEPDRLLGIGIGGPNANGLKGTIEPSANLPWMEVIPVTELLEKQTRLPTFVDNDANIATLGEYLFGVARGLQNFYVITLGTGIGAGIVAEGHLLHGGDGKAGEMGHFILRPGGRPCGCGRKGCFETYCSAKGMTTTVRELLEESHEKRSLLAEIPASEITSLEVFKAACRGDALALETFTRTGRLLGEGLANLATFLSPEAIILFGGLTKAWRFLEAPLRESFDKHRLYALTTPKVLCSSLPEANAAILGAAALAFGSLKA